MKIRIRPFPNHQITDKCLQRDVIDKSQKVNTSNSTDASNLLQSEMLMVAHFDDGNKGVYKTTIPIEVNGVKYISAFMEPVHLFFSSSIGNYETSEVIKNEFFPKYGHGKKLVGVNDTIILDFQHNQVNEYYAKYFEYRITSIIMLMCSVEAFINRLIPISFTTSTNKGERDKQFIELRFKLEEKLDRIIPEIKNNNNFWKGYEDSVDKIKELHKIRNSMAHLKTKGEDDFKAYLDDIKTMLEYDIPNSIGDTADFINMLSGINGGDFIEFI